MYDGEPNQGMRCIRDILSRFSDEISYREFDVRGKAEIPDVRNFDIFISTGGPGDPTEGDGHWDLLYNEFLDQIWIWNLSNSRKKQLLLICHSFQMACRHFGLGQITQRKSTSFGVTTIHKTPEGMQDPLFLNLLNPFWAVDSRDYQVVQPDKRKLKSLGAKLIALEKIRNHVEYERAIMAIRISDEIVGTQFHPEADAVSFLEHLKKPMVREKIIELKGKAKFRNMLEDLVDENKIYKTNETLIPNFLGQAIQKLRLLNTPSLI
ncbi:GMP synthase-Glutamine amidotransferase [Algoriphagus alkaliphilus]|uniref:GMP synthase-Glutamine amidotransferase n=2 Tax=Algoriphagus alkaliphilus TaxID=279824 RepID=A0A1G5ZJX0_9BACT|nr:GMP synthase [Cyclobacterium sp.]SDA95139.1 GMP synthase-Glutamine amidotransferase [Algoriphagus alkaliphilus]